MTDEFSFLPDNAAEAGLVWSGPPAVQRVSVEVADGRDVTALVWGRGSPELVLLHGGGQNAHTFDTVALALDRPLVALDLPGHGHSGWRADHRYTPAAMADDVAMALHRLAPGAQVVAGMSLGGLTALSLAAGHPELVSRLALVDITPGTNAAQAEPILAFLAGPERFAGFDEMLDRTIAFNPTRTVSSLRRGVFHNARPFEDGSWGWRWDPSARWRHGTVETSGAPAEPDGFRSLWTAVAALRVPLLLVTGSRSPVVSRTEIASRLAFTGDITARGTRGGASSPDPARSSCGRRGHP